MTNPVATLAPEEAVQKLKYYQKGTFTVGNRLVAEAERSVQASRDRSNALTCGPLRHRRSDARHQQQPDCGQRNWLP